MRRLARRAARAALRALVCGRITPALSRVSFILWRTLYREGRRAKTPP